MCNIHARENMLDSMHALQHFPAMLQLCTNFPDHGRGCGLMTELAAGARLADNAGSSNRFMPSRHFGTWPVYLLL